MIKTLFALLISILFIQNNGFAAKIKIENLMDVPEFNFYIDSVIVVQEEQEVIGYRFKHKKLKSFKLEEKRIDRTLQDLFQQSFPFEAGKRRLILKINRIIYNTLDQSSEFGANITFIEKVNGQLVDLGTIRSSWVNENTLSNSFSAKVRGDDLVINLAFLFLEFVAYEEANKSLNKNMLTEADLSSSVSLTSSNFPILSQPKPS
jgi:hypothetical protein